MEGVKSISEYIEKFEPIWTVRLGDIEDIDSGNFTERVKEGLEVPNNTLGL